MDVTQSMELEVNNGSLEDLKELDNVDTPRRKKRKEFDFKDASEEEEAKRARKLETKQKKEEERLEKQRIKQQKAQEKEEANRLRQIEKEKREQERQRKEEERLKLQKEREEKKKLKEAEKKAKEEEKRKREEEKKAKKEQEELEKKKRQEELLLKKQKKEAEEKAKEEAKRAKEEEEKRKIELRKKQSAILMNFVQIGVEKDNIEDSNPFKTVGRFDAWHPSQDSIIAPCILDKKVFNEAEFEANLLKGLSINKSQWIESFVNKKANAQSMKDERIRKRKERFRDTIDFDSVEEGESKVFQDFLLGLRIKYFKFHDTIKPDYFGSFSTRSLIISPRNPVGQDETIDYDIDSDEEWQDAIGEDLGDSGEEDDMEPPEEYEYDEFLVDDDHLSDGEGWSSDDDPDSRQRVHLPKEGGVSKGPEIIGPILEYPTNDSKIDEIIGFYSIELLVDDPLNIVIPTESNDKKQKTNRVKAFPENLVPELALLIQNAACSSFGTLTEKCIEKFPDVSKRQIVKKINEISSKVKPEGWKKGVYLVNQSLRESLNISVQDPPPPAGEKPERIIENMMTFES